jgi:hypothetical protein
MRAPAIWHAPWQVIALDLPLEDAPMTVYVAQIPAYKNTRHFFPSREEARSWIERTIRKEDRERWEIERGHLSLCRR